MARSPTHESYVCTGKDCRRDEGFRELLCALADGTRVREVDCQDLCEGPVAGVVVAGKVEWFERVRKPRAREAVVALATGTVDDVPKVLRPRWAKKRSGKVKR